MKSKNILIALIALAAVCGCRGGAPAVVDNRPMADVETLVLDAPFDIVYAPCCWPQQVDVLAAPEDQDKISVTCEDGLMKVSGEARDAKLYLSGPTATGYINESDKGNIILDGDVFVDGDVSVTVRGKGSISFTGLKCAKLVVNIEGSGNVEIGYINAADGIVLNRTGKGNLITR
ncbi:MAG: DUF2807 domain-containing protein [Bacteroidales bacterium]|nr:DUF2807 domain-containing protein [Bacteroidales bacterium]